ncbi:MAG TPA: hypothetical protein VIZ31_10600, partial [Vicinamibacteria bacterium]
MSAERKGLGLVLAGVAAAGMAASAQEAPELTFGFENVAQRAGLTATTVFGGREQNKYLLETT